MTKDIQQKLTKVSGEYLAEMTIVHQDGRFLVDHTWGDLNANKVFLVPIVSMGIHITDNRYNVYTLPRRAWERKKIDENR